MVPYQASCKFKNQSRQDAFPKQDDDLFSIPVLSIIVIRKTGETEESAPMRVWGNLIVTLRQAMRLSKRVGVEKPGLGKTPGFDLG